MNWGKKRLQLSADNLRLKIKSEYGYLVEAEKDNSTYLQFSSISALNKLLYQYDRIQQRCGIYKSFWVFVLILLGVVVGMRIWG